MRRYEERERDNEISCSKHMQSVVRSCKEILPCVEEGKGGHTSCQISFIYVAQIYYVNIINVPTQNTSFNGIQKMRRKSKRSTILKYIYLRD